MHLCEDDVARRSFDINVLYLLSNSNSVKPSGSNRCIDSCAQQKAILNMDKDETPAPSCTALSLTTLADGVLTLFTPRNSNQSITQETAKSPSPKEKTRSVNFQHPLITKTHVRPMTEDHDIENLFFTEEEMEELEDDRNATKFADDVEVLADGESWDVLIPQVSTSGSNLSIEENYVPANKPMPVKVGTVQNELSPRTKTIQALSILSERRDTKNQKRRLRKNSDDCINNAQGIEIVKPKIVQGVHIVLREKSSTNDMYMM